MRISIGIMLAVENVSQSHLCFRNNVSATTSLSLTGDRVSRTNFNIFVQNSLFLKRNGRVESFLAWIIGIVGPYSLLSVISSKILT